MADCEIDIRVTPRSSRNRIEVVDGQIKAWVMAAPTDGQANEAIERLFATTLGISNSSVCVVRGQSSRVKRLRILGCTLALALETIVSKQ